MPRSCNLSRYRKKKEVGAVPGEEGGYSMAFVGLYLWPGVQAHYHGVKPKDSQFTNLAFLIEFAFLKAAGCSNNILCLQFDSCRKVQQ